MSADSDLRKVFKHIEESEEIRISSTARLAGGSINEVYRLQTSKGKRVLKVNEADRFPGMFDAEQAGLNILRSKSKFIIPEVGSAGTSGNFSYLLLEYIPEGRQSRDFWNIFAENLAALHQNSAPEFGFPSSNYIGSLPQFNNSEVSAADFYIRQRLEPQLRMAEEQGFKFDSLGAALKNITAAIPEEPPALIHGDLWSGNYLISEAGLPCLIDPAVSYGPREMDLAMMKLFGGFPEEVFRRYSEIFPLPDGFQDRIPLWQLYYLLVHLNIFGSSYFSQVVAILKKYS